MSTVWATAWAVCRMARSVAASLQTGILPDHERGETQDWHERHEHERNEMATKSHGPREAAPG